MFGDGDMAEQYGIRESLGTIDGFFNAVAAMNESLKNADGTTKKTEGVVVEITA